MTGFPEIREGLVIRPGDTVLFAVQDQTVLDTPEAVEDFTRRIREVMPIGVEIVITDSTQVTIAVVRREEES